MLQERIRARFEVIPVISKPANQHPRCQPQARPTAYLRLRAVSSSRRAATEVWAKPELWWIGRIHPAESMAAFAFVVDEVPQSWALTLPYTPWCF